MDRALLSDTSTEGIMAKSCTPHGSWYLRIHRIPWIALVLAHQHIFTYNLGLFIAPAPHHNQPTPLPTSGGFFDGITSSDQRRAYLLSILNAPSPAEAAAAAGGAAATKEGTPDKPGPGEGDGQSHAAAAAAAVAAALPDAQLSDLLARSEEEREIFGREDARRAAAEEAAAARWAATRSGAAAGAAAEGLAGAPGAAAPRRASAAAVPRSRLATPEECADMIREALEAAAPKPKEDPLLYGRGMPRASRQPQSSQPASEPLPPLPPAPVTPVPAATPAHSAPAGKGGGAEAGGAAPCRGRRTHISPLAAAVAKGPASLGERGAVDRRAGSEQTAPQQGRTFAAAAAARRGSGGRTSSRSAPGSEAAAPAVEEEEEATSPPGAPLRQRERRCERPSPAAALEASPMTEDVAAAADSPLTKGATAAVTAAAAAALIITAAAAPEEEASAAAPSMRKRIRGGEELPPLLAHEKGSRQPADGRPDPPAKRQYAQACAGCAAAPHVAAHVAAIAPPQLALDPAAARVPIASTPAAGLPANAGAAFKRPWRNFGVAGPAGARLSMRKGAAKGAEACRPVELFAPPGREGEALSVAIAAAMQ
jgi:hypothetical protein